jgi:hypothetical protein
LALNTISRLNSSAERKIELFLIKLISGHLGLLLIECFVGIFRLNQMTALEIVNTIIKFLQWSHNSLPICMNQRNNCLHYVYRRIQTIDQMQRDCRNCHTLKRFNGSYSTIKYIWVIRRMRNKWKWTIWTITELIRINRISYFNWVVRKWSTIDIDRRIKRNMSKCCPIRICQRMSNISISNISKLWAIKAKNINALT